MKFFSQNDYPQDLLGESKNVTIKEAGCYLTSLAMLLNTEPPELNKKLRLSKGNFICETLIDSSKVSENLELKYKYSKSMPKEELVICETKMSPQHFFVYNTKTGLMADTLSNLKKWEKLKYKIVSFRVWTGNNEKQQNKRRAILLNSKCWHYYSPDTQKALHNANNALRNEI